MEWWWFGECRRAHSGPRLEQERDSSESSGGEDSETKRAREWWRPRRELFFQSMTNEESYSV